MNRRIAKLIGVVILCVMLLSTTMVVNGISNRKHTEQIRSMEIHVRNLEKDLDSMKDTNDLNKKTIDALTKELEELKNQIK